MKKEQLIFAAVAVLGAFAIYWVKESEGLAIGFVGLVFGIYKSYRNLDLKDENQMLKKENATLEMKKNVAEAKLK